MGVLAVQGFVEAEDYGGDHGEGCGVGCVRKKQEWTGKLG
jgi:hypothetical protein